MLSPTTFPRAKPRTDDGLVERTHTLSQARLIVTIVMEQWKYLRHGDSGLPPLWVKASFNEHGYSIRLTDLSRIWAERLDKDDIITRARFCNCSIDPSEDVEQHDILLEKLQSTLQQQGETSLALSTQKDGSVQLHLEAPLPSPLPAFQWEINLKQMSDCSVEVDLVSPLLQQAHNLNRHMQALIAEIRAKDKVIAKITDRLDSAGYGLADVFPGAANSKLPSKKPQREQIARHVRGLGQFDEDAWAAEIAASSNTSSTPRESADAVFASLPLVISDAAESPTSEKWWQQLPPGRHITLSDPGPDNLEAERKKLHHEQSLNELSKLKASRDDDGGDFQRQATPPHLRAQPRPPAIHDDIHMSEADGNPPPDEDSTEDEDDLDGPPPKSKLSQHHTHNNSVHTHPLVETRTKTPSPPPVVNPTAQAPTNHGPFTHEEDTEDDDDLDGPSQPPQKASSASQLPSRHKSQTPQPSSPKASPPRRKPGTFGGRARTKSPTPPKEPDEEDHTPASPPPPDPNPNPKPKAKLGTLGGRKPKPQPTPPPAPTTTSSNAATPPPGKKLGTIGGKRESKTSRAATASATPEPQRTEPAEVREPDVKAEAAEPEDPVERANAKRDALKRQLAEKAKAPVKKKRKF